MEIPRDHWIWTLQRGGYNALMRVPGALQSFLRHSHALWTCMRLGCVAPLSFGFKVGKRQCL